MPVMVGNVSVAVVQWSWSMIIYCRFHMVVAMMFQTFSYFAKNAIAVSRIIPIAKYIIRKWEKRRMKIQVQKANRQFLQTHAVPAKRCNVQVLPRKAQDVRIKQSIKMENAIYTPNSTNTFI